MYIIIGKLYTFIQHVLHVTVNKVKEKAKKSK